MCPTPRRCARSLTDGPRRWPLQPWDGWAAQPADGVAGADGEAVHRRPVFRNSTPAEADTSGDPSQAGLAQVMQGRSSDPDRVRELMADDPTDWHKFRPDILDTVSVGHDGDAWTMAIYLTSEEAAREGEQKEPPRQMQEMMKEMGALTVGQPVFFDLRDPWLHASR